MWGRTDYDPARDAEDANAVIRKRSLHPEKLPIAIVWQNDRGGVVTALWQRHTLEDQGLALAVHEPEAWVAEGDLRHVRTVLQDPETDRVCVAGLKAVW